MNVSLKDINFIKLLDKKLLLEKFNLLSGPYQEIYQKVEICLNDGNFSSMNNDWSSIEKIIQRM